MPLAVDAVYLVVWNCSRGPRRRIGLSRETRASRAHVDGAVTGQVDVRMSEKSPRAQDRAGRSRLRVICISLLGVAAVYISAVSAFQVLKSTLSPPTPETELNCRSGASALYDSVVSARMGLPRQPLTERQAVAHFRSAVEPVWRFAPTILAKCRNSRDIEGLKALRSVELLRYAEERAVRTSALDLSKWRETAPRLLKPLTPGK